MRNILREKRKEKNYTQGNMAELLNISRPYYSKIESGSRMPTFILARKIKAVVNYSHDDLFDDYKNERKECNCEEYKK